jgi:steroid 5-alpha reductase family enzyme
MRKYSHLLASYVPALAIVVALISTGPLSSFAIGNVVAQAVLFTALAAIPAQRTGRMSYVDIAWPAGLVAIGLQVPIFSSHFGPSAIAVAAAYLAIGLRMALPGIAYLVRFHRLNGEFSRYRFRRIQWEADGWRDDRIPMHLEIGVQALANASVLAVPALLVAADADQRLNTVRLAAMVMWAGCWSLEWLADRQKRQFGARAERRATCDVGLWRYSRHPNYFFQWLGWVALALAATPTLIHLARTMPAAEVAVLALALAGASAFMLWTLLVLTGIKPAEHYSVLKRPGYAAYQRVTSTFVPWPPRSFDATAATPKVSA